MLLLIVATIFTLAFPVAAADGVTVMRLRGKYSPAFLIAAWTRSVQKTIAFSLTLTTVTAFRTRTCAKI